MVGHSYDCTGALQQFCRNLLVHLVVFNQQDTDSRGIMHGGVVLPRTGTVVVKPRNAEQIHQRVVEQRLIDGLQQIAFNANLLCLRSDFFPTEGGDHHDFWNILQAIVSLDDAAGLQSIHSRHVPVHQYQTIRIRRIGGSYLANCVFPRRNRVGPDRKYPECLGEDLARLRVVVHNQRSDAREIRNKALVFLFRSDPEPRSEMEGAAYARFALSPDGAVHHLNQAFGDRESKAGAAILSRRRSVRLRERLEQPGALLGCHADASVANGEPHLHPVR